MFIFWEEDNSSNFLLIPIVLQIIPGCSVKSIVQFTHYFKFRQKILSIFHFNYILQVTIDFFGIVDKRMHLLVFFYILHIFMVTNGK
jgi:hypothetical protein